MDCAAQAAELIRPYVSTGDTILDAGCGSGYLFHSLAKRNIPAIYYGIDASPTLIAIGKEIMPSFGLSADHLQVIRIEDLEADVDHVICLNVLSNIDNYHKPLERLMLSAKKTLVLRESLSDHSSYRYVEDKYLDVPLNVYVNTYSMKEISGFIESYGFSVEIITDQRTGGRPEMVIGYPHYWTFILAIKKGVS